MKNWKVPAVILVLLILAITFRWNIEKTTYKKNSMNKIVVDRWNGSIWNEKADTLYHYRDPIAVQWEGLPNSDSLTKTWGIILGIDIIWLLYAVIKTKKGGKVHENEQKTN